MSDASNFDLISRAGRTPAGGSRNLMNAPGPADPRERWGELTRQERDAAYDNNAATHDSAELVAARNEASAAFRARGDWRLDLPMVPNRFRSGTFILPPTRTRRSWYSFTAAIGSATAGNYSP
jgi:hypothetical protein